MEIKAFSSHSENKFAEFPNGSRTHDLSEYRLDALATELWRTHGGGVWS